MPTLIRLFLNGLLIVVPISVTISLLYWLAQVTDHLLGSWAAWFLPETASWRGLGLALGVALIIALGGAMEFGAGRVAFEWLGRLMERIPIVRMIYGATRDLLGYFVQEPGKKHRRFSKVALVTLGPQGTKLLGLITREDLSDLPKGADGKDQVLIYFPMSYQLGGYTTIVPRELVQPIEMSVEEAMRFTMTGGVSSNHTA